MQAPTLNRITQTQHLASKAVDHSAKDDPYIYAPEDGKIDSYQQRGSGKGDAGNALRMTGATGLHQFAHCEKSYVKKGDKVKRGQKIAKMGYTGYTIPSGPAGAHLHYWILTPHGYVYPPKLYKEKFIKEINLSDKEIISIGANYVRFQIGKTISKRESAKWLKIFKEKGFNECKAWVKGWKRYKAAVANSKAGKLKAENHLPYTIRKVYKKPSTATYLEVKETLYKKK